MNPTIRLTDRIHYIGAHDRRKHLFENMWPLPEGVSYNCYLILDEKTVLVDTVEMGSDGDFVGQVKALLAGRTLDYLVINHMEPDHTGEIGNIVRTFPSVKIVGNKKTFNVLQAYFGITENLVEVADGETIDVGHHKLQFIYTPWVHWPETMMTYDLTEKVLFSGDAFGSFGALGGGVFDDEVEFSYYEGEMRRYYSNIVGKYSNMVQKAFAKLSCIEIKTICPVHGPVWRKDVLRVLGLYDRWSKQEGEHGVVVAYASMYGNTARMADYIARKVSEGGVRHIRVHDVSKTHASFLISEIWKYNGLILGSCAYNTQMHPMMDALTRELELLGVKNKHVGLFGTYSWNGGGVRSLNDFAGRIGWEQAAPAAEIHGAPTAEKTAACDVLAAEIAKRVIE